MLSTEQSMHWNFISNESVSLFVWNATAQHHSETTTTGPTYSTSSLTVCPSVRTYLWAGQTTTTTTTTILNECKILTKIQIAFVFVGNVYIFTQSTAIITVGAWGEKRLSFPLLMKLAQQQRPSLPGRTNSQNGIQERYTLQIRHQVARPGSAKEVVVATSSKHPSEKVQKTCACVCLCALNCPNFYTFSGFFNSQLTTLCGWNMYIHSNKNNTLSSTKATAICCCCCCLSSPFCAKETS